MKGMKRALKIDLIKRQFAGMRKFHKRPDTLLFNKQRKEIICLNMILNLIT